MAWGPSARAEGLARSAPLYSIPRATAPKKKSCAAGEEGAAFGRRSRSHAGACSDACGAGPPARAPARIGARTRAGGTRISAWVVTGEGVRGLLRGVREGRASPGLDVRWSVVFACSSYRCSMSSLEA